MEAEEFIGKTLEEARIICKKLGLPNRVSSVDGHIHGVTDDCIPERINFIIEKDLIINVDFG